MPTQGEEKNLAVAHRYIELIERFAQPAEFEGILHPNIQLEMYPNLLAKDGTKSDYAKMVAGPQQGRKLLSDNRYEIKNAFTAGDFVTIEMIWTGTLAIPVMGMAVGAQLKAFIATILQFQDGQIIAQRQYDCYEPLPIA